eukprot:2845947-Prymnesium_polylepis.3
MRSSGWLRPQAQRRPSYYTSSSEERVITPAITGIARDAILEVGRVRAGLCATVDACLHTCSGTRTHTRCIACELASLYSVLQVESGTLVCRIAGGACRGSLTECLG